jgi:tRNA A37 N6-isopentenylltransferase MiaA
LMDWLQNGADPKILPDLRNLIVVKTRQYAKRQLTFWKKLEKDLISLPSSIAICNNYK